MLTLSAILALTGGLFGQPAFSEQASADRVPAGTGAFDEGPDGDPFADPIEIRREIQSGEKVDSMLSKRFEPLHKRWDPFADKLSRNGLEITFQYTAMVQNSSDLKPGIEDEIPGAQNTLSGGDADLFVKWQPTGPERPGRAISGCLGNIATAIANCPPPGWRRKSDPCGQR